MTPRRLLLLVVLALTGTGIALAGGNPAGVISPKNRIQNNGRQLNPFGRMVRVGNFPTGGTLTRDGHYFWSLSAGRGRNDIRIVRVSKVGSRRAGKVVQTISMPGLSGGIVMAPDGRTAYVSGVAESDKKDQRTAADVPGKKGDVLHVFRYDRRTGLAVRRGVIPVPPPSSAPPYQTFPPNAKDKLAWPRDLAISGDGRILVAALNLADAAAIVDTKTRKVRYLPVGRYPYGAAISRDGRRGFVTSETQGFVTAIDLKTGKKITDITVGPPLSHPEGMASDTRSNLIFVAITNQDNIAAIDSRTLEVVKTIHVGRPQGIGTFPTALKVTRDGCSLLSANSGEDAVAVIALSRKRSCDRGTRPRRARPLTLVGRIPVGSYPTAVDATPARRTLVWLSARGLGTGPNPRGPNPLSKNNNDDQINKFQYLPSFVRGSAGYGSFPTDRQITAASGRVYKQLRPVNARKPPAGTPLRSGGPIKNVFYIIKENRTYDQVLGDDPRGDGDPNLNLFNKDSTPNQHALAKRFPLLDHVYANSEASIDGHYWTAAGAVSDYVVKAWHQNYAGRGRPYDFGAYNVSAPPKNYLFQRAENEGISYFNYGEALAGVSPFPDRDQPAGGPDRILNSKVLAKSDVGTPLPPPFCYESDLSNSTVLSRPPPSPQVYDSSVPLVGADPGAKSRFDCFRTRFTSQLATNSVPAFNYLVLPNDHTEGTTPGRRTPRAQVASNDYGLGQIVDTISKSKIWKQSLILVIEDDSQDGADHVDAHRIPALAISPYTRRGAVVRDRYDQLSFVRSLEMIIGMKPRNLAEALATPLYSAFSSSPANGEPYNALVPKQSLTEKNTASSPGAAQSRGLNFRQTDKVPQRVLDGLLWKSVYGANSKPPPPGPNASGIDEGKSGR